MKIVFVNNGPYENHGCEAIIRGTVALFDAVHQDISYVNIAHFRSFAQVRRHNEVDGGKIRHYPANLLNTGLLRKVVGRIMAKVSPKMYRRLAYRHIRSLVDDASIVLSVGGDNYSFDYGYPYPMIHLDEAVFAAGRHCAVWGASIGPFDRDPDFERFMKRHLERFNSVFVREEETASYLESIGAGGNVVRSSDPAFSMMPKRPQHELALPDTFIGLNVSPLIQKFSGGAARENLLGMYADIVDAVVEHTGKDVVLIPHVNKKNNNDFLLLQDVAALVRRREKVTLVGDAYGAEELKHMIGQSEVFIGARTHATIAAFSSAVPTISISYSIKSIGLNRRLYGHTDHIIKSDEISVDAVLEKLNAVYEDYANMQKVLAERVEENRALLRRNVDQIIADSMRMSEGKQWEPKQSNR